MNTNMIFCKIDLYKNVIQKNRPLSQKEVKELDAYFRIGTTYSSNALEGNSLTLSETKVLLENGLTVGGKPIRDCYEATGHAKAYDYMLAAARSENLVISEALILKLHYLFYNGIDSESAGKYRNHQVFITGTEYLPPEAKDLSDLMAVFIAELLVKQSELHPIALASYAHRRLVDIHPFSDGNGRTARLLMNLILVNKGYSIVSIPPILRHEYIASLQEAQRANNPSDTKFVALIAECEIEAQKEYCRMFRIELPKEHDTRDAR